ncbi:DUF262 domain-containing protein [Macrococcoides caseolyticum]|uniref:DUF262 domain-containing protein n=1 Tax=Macrococcoides caseolyticum TaxID=69966 RepID=UPI0010614288|nr:DUF262 domain-containing protein [Macrococcus caseolyticus]TDM26658.1 DUF262 domain-containing protein [Macrococcus caseolyticus]
MTLITDDLKILSLKDLMLSSNGEGSLTLKIPFYQRPYRWSSKSANQLFMDIYEAFNNNTSEYRLGSVILHKDNDFYNIVDGQQRLTTLSILLFVIKRDYENELSLLNEAYDDLSHAAIVRNLDILKKRVGELSLDEIKRLEQYLLERCTIVQIVTDNVQEAFQFFDSQNSRGKALAPHDLLKSYHLREMKHNDEQATMDLIQQWENIDQARLSLLFEWYLYPIHQWQRNKDGIGYSSKNIDVFKGINADSTFNYAMYHKASHLYVEQFNRSGNHELFASTPITQFQLTEPIIAGRRFFEYILYYEKLLKKVAYRINDANLEDPEVLGNESVRGDWLTKRLYEAVVLLFIDRFGEEAFTSRIENILYTWSYSIRLHMKRVSKLTINKYAQGNHDLNTGLNLFERIKEMRHPNELMEILFKKPEHHDKYEIMKEEIFKINHWSLNNDE